MTMINKEELIAKMIRKLNKEDAYNEDEKNVLVEALLLVYGAKPEADCVTLETYENEVNELKSIIEEKDKRIDDLKKLLWSEHMEVRDED